MHILFLTDNFAPEFNAPASRTYEHCREWVRAGHKVTVITCAPNFPKGKVFDGYRNRLWQSEIMDGIRVIRVWTYITANEGFIKRVLDYLSFMISSVLAAPFVRGVDVVVGTSPQFFTVCAASFTARLKRVPWIFELRDLWPASIRAVGAMNDSLILDLFEKMEMYLYRRADAIVSVTNSFRDILIARGIDKNKISVVTNGVDIGRFTPRPKDADLVTRHQLEGKFVAGYIGTLGMAHALDTILDAAKILGSAPDASRFQFILLGTGANKNALVDRVRTEQIDNVLFVDSVPKDEVVRYWSLLDVSIIHLKKDELFTTVIPSKLFECMGMSIPVLHGVEGESADIVKMENVGIVFEPENARALSDGLRELAGNQSLYSQIRENGPRSAVKYDRSVLAARMLEIISSVVQKK